MSLLEAETQRTDEPAAETQGAGGGSDDGAGKKPAKPKGQGGGFRRFMRVTLRVLLILISIVLVLAIAVAGWVAWTIERSFPQTSGEVTVSGISDRVDVIRDSYGVPTIVANTSEDLFFAQGFVHAQDRFWEMDFRRHMTAGRLSELFGASQVGTDSFLRTLGWRATAEEEVRNLDEQSRSYFQAYADGVNAYLADHQGAELSFEYVVLGLTTPGYEPEPWEIADSIAWLKAMAWDLRSNMDDELERAQFSLFLNETELADLFPEYNYEDRPVIMPESSELPSTALTAVDAATASTTRQIEGLSALFAEVSALVGNADPSIGSNSWVIASENTATGGPLLANDPHLSASLPSIWHQVNLHCSTLSADCPFRVSGFGFSGFPGVVIGHNNQIAWGFTNLGPDVADLYLEKVQGNQYWVDDELEPLEVREEIIKVAGDDDVPLTIRSTKHGPIISGLYGAATTVADNGESILTNPDTEEAENGAEPADIPPGDFALSLRWTALQPGTTPSAIFLMNTAQNFDDFRYAASRFNVPSQNLVYADTSGNIGYQAPGLIPIRGTGDGTELSIGWDSAYDWQGYIPFEELPYSYNPEEGYIVTANNAVVDEEYPYLITQDWDYGYRAERIETLIESKLSTGRLTALDMKQIQADNYNWMAAQLVPELLAGLPVTQGTAGALSLLSTWNFHDDADSAASAYFNVIWKNLLHEMFTTKYPELEPSGNSIYFTIVANLLEQPDSSWWQNREIGVSGIEQMLTHVAELAYTELAELQGNTPQNWNWGDLHAITLTHGTFGTSGITPIEMLFNRGPFPVGGGSSIVNANGWRANEGYETKTVPSLRMVVDLANLDKSEWNHLTGNSGHIFHPNYTDQFANWQEVRLQAWPFSLSEIRNQAVDILILRNN